MTILVTRDSILAHVRSALEEDIGTGDLTAHLIPETLGYHAQVICREPVVLCGCDWFDAVFHTLDARIRIDWQFREGDRIAANALLCTLEGSARALLTGERTALNFLQTLSGTATLARQYADQVNGTGVRLLDTRKTIPGLRLEQKYAVACGGCANHRVGLFDAILIKENHILAVGGIGPAIAAARRQHPGFPVQIEVENLAELAMALDYRPERILLDNFAVPLLREAVALNAGRARLEASGGITLDNLRAVAETGVDDISLGSLTKDVRACDLSMRFSASHTAPDWSPGGSASA